MAGLGFFANGLYQKTAGELAVAEQKIQGLETKLTETKTASETPQPEPPTQQPTAVSESLFAELSSTSTEALKNSLPLSIQGIRETHELSPGIVIAIFDESNLESAWLLDLNKMQFKQIGSVFNQGSGFHFSRWSGGWAVVEITTPGEAVGNTRTKYLDPSGQVVAETISGTYNRPGDTMELNFGARLMVVRTIKKASCTDFGYEYTDQTKAYQPPTTTVIGLSLNDKLFPLPQPTIVECDEGYGENIGDPVLPDPTFDGHDIGFHIPGYGVTVTPNGVIKYSPTLSYYIPCNYGATNGEPELMRLIREDATGIHQINSNIWKDSVLSKISTGEYCFDSNGLNGNVARFVVQKIGEKGFEDTGTVEYNIQKGKFENLVLSK